MVYSSEETQEKLERLARLIRGAGHAEGLIPAQWDVLRYLARANRFSNSPIATAHYLGTTKGTISQTIQALLRKDLVTSVSRGNDARSVVLTLTEKGEALLARDPLATIGKDLAALRGKTQKHLGRAVADLLQSETTRQGAPLFGSCEGCRMFLAGKEPACASFGERLSDVDLTGLCQKFRAVKSKTGQIEK